MKTRLILALGCVAAGAFATAADMPAGHVMVNADKIMWGTASPALPAGSNMTVITGDPATAGSAFTLRVKMPAGYKVPPHWHPTDENVTVMSGTVAMGMGEAWDDKALMAMPVGSFSAMPAKTPHYLVAKTAAIVQVHGVGPFALTYVNPKDDPRMAAPAATK